MKKKKKSYKKNIIIFLLVFLAIIFLVGYNLLFTDTSLSQTGPVEISDHRDFDTRAVSATNIIENLDAPWAFEFLENEDIIITERFGNLVLVREGEKYIITGVPEVFSRGQGGLLDVTAHPEFLENNYIYLSYSHGTQEGNRLRVARAELVDFSLENLEIIFEVAQTKTGSSHFGSRFEWLLDGTLIFSVGDGGNPPTQYNGELIREQAQYLNSHLGKIIRINDDGTIPEDNPFVGRPDVSQEIYSYGHRNIQGIAYDTLNNRIIASEHGSKGGDELNVVMPGANYGWPLVTYSTEYDFSGTPISDSQTLSQMEDPIIVWTPTIAPSEIVYYTGDKYNGWRGDLFLAAMLLREDNSFAAYASSPAGSVFRIELDEQGKVVGQERLFLGDYRVRSIEQGLDGYLYVLTDSTSRQSRPGINSGTIWRIEN